MHENVFLIGLNNPDPSLKNQVNYDTSTYSFVFFVKPAAELTKKATIVPACRYNFLTISKYNKLKSGKVQIPTVAVPFLMQALLLFLLAVIKQYYV